MRHGKRNIKFGRHPAHRKATVYSLVRNLVKYKKIETTLAKAKEARRLADRLVTWGKKGTMHDMRMAYSILADRDLVGILFKDIATLFKNRKGGYTRVLHTRRRVGDNAEMAILEWTEVKAKEAPVKKSAKKEEKAASEKKEKHEEPKAKKEYVETKKEHVEAKQEAKKEVHEPKVQEEQHKPAEKIKDHLKNEVKRPEAPKQIEGHKQKKGFLGGLRKLFDQKDK